MRLFLDTEFNGFDGELISMGIIDEVGGYFYEVLPLPERVDPWVAEHVVPFLDRPPIDPVGFRGQLFLFLSEYDCPEIIVDWPSDILRFTQVLLGGSHLETLFYPCTFRVMSLDGHSVVPHNALHDAIANKEAFNGLHTTSFAA